MKFMAVLGLAGVLFCVGAVAGEGPWYGGVEAGYSEYRFTPEYTFMDGRPDKEFENVAYGMEIGLVGGYELSLGEMVKIAGELRVTGSDAEWKLVIADEPAELIYRVPYTVGLGIVPAVDLLDGAIRVFAEAGIVQGRVEEEKVSSTRSSYDQDGWETGYTLGGGLAIRVTDALSVQAKYRYTTYDCFTYDTHMPDGSLWETVKDDPEADSYLVAATYSF